MIERVLGKNLLSIGPFFLIVILSFPALRPLMEPGYLEGHDSLVHLFRLVEFHRQFSDGDYYPRWFPDFALGYGYPLLNFYSPLLYFVAEAFHLLGLGFVDAIKAAIAFSVILSGWGMYVYVNFITGRRTSALLAAVAYMYLPYRLVDIYVRGTFTEVLVLAFLPFLLITFHLLATRGAASQLVISSLLLAGLLLSHPTALFFVPVLVGYVFVVSRRSPAPINRIAVSAAALVLGFALASFNWLPALAEREYASLDNFTALGTTPISQLVGLQDLIQRQLLYDYQDFPFKVGLAEAALAIAGLLVVVVNLFRGRRDVTPSLVLPAFGGLFAFMMSTPSSILWDKMSLVSSIQFPWRLLSFIGLSTATYAAFVALPRRWGPILAVAGSIFLIGTSTMALQVVRVDIPPSSLSIGTIARHEFDSGIIGTTYAAEFLPAVARAEMVSPADGPQKIPPQDGLPAFDRATLVRTGPLAFRLAVSAPQATSLRFHAFAFPGWRAKVDGISTPVYPSPYLGVVTVDVPAGEHTVDISFEDTPVRTASRLASIIALLLLVAISFHSGRQRQLRSGYPIGLALAVIPLLVLFGDLAPKAPALMEDALQPVGQRPLQADLGGSVRLLGFEVRIASPGNGADAEIVLYWQPLRPIAGDIFASLAWITPESTPLPAGAGWPIFATSPARTWSSNEVVRDLRTLRLPDRPLSKARLQLTVWEDGHLLGTVDLGRMEQVPFRPSSPNSPSGVGDLASFGGKVGLADFRVDRQGKGASSENEGSEKMAGGELIAMARPGDSLRVDLSWSALAELPDDFTVFVHLYDAKTELVTQHDSQPAGGFRPTSLWQRGEVVDDSHILSIPSSTPPGIYRLEAGLYQLRSLERLEIAGSGRSSLPLGRVKIVPAPVKLSPPNRLEIAFGGAVTLLGYDLSDGSFPAGADHGGKLKLNLFWRVAGTVGKDYRVFVHLLDGAGAIIAQRDSDPLDGNYPTSYWAQGEEFADQHTLQVPAGGWERVERIVVGLYDPATGERLPTSSGADSVTIPVAVTKLR